MYSSNVAASVLRNLYPLISAIFVFTEASTVLYIIWSTEYLVLYYWA